MKKVLVLFWGLSTLVGCSQSPLNHQTPSSWKAHQQRILDKKTWEAEGRCAVAPTQGRSGTASFLWKQAPNFYELSLTGPFHAPVIIHGKPGQVTFHGGKQTTQVAPTGEALLEELTGWHLPVSALAYWVRGVPSPYSPYTLHNFYPDGQLASFSQDDWHIEYQSFQDDLLPERVIMRHPTMRVKWFIRRWHA